MPIQRVPVRRSHSILLKDKPLAPPGEQNAVVLFPRKWCQCEESIVGFNDQRHPLDNHLPVGGVGRVKGMAAHSRLEWPPCGTSLAARCARGAREGSTGG